MTMTKIDTIFGEWMSGLFWVGLVQVFFLWPTLPGYSQELDSQGPVDYDKLFNESLKRGGKLLDLSGKKIGDAGVDRLIASGILGKVEKVDLRYNEISATGAKRIAEMSPLPKIKVLIMRHNILGDVGSLALAQSKSFPNLREMQLGWTETRDAGALAFGKTTNFPKLKKLDLRGNFLANATKDSLKKSLERLRSLKLY
jgi:Ran GTPase-activating protein (RanGAP) involved in mRNA processing and transport